MRSRVTLLIVTFFVMSWLGSNPATRTVNAAQVVYAAQATVPATSAASASLPTAEATALATTLATPSEPATGSAAYLGVLTHYTAQGLEVTEVVPGGPADVAGFKVGDVVVSVNGKAIAPANPLSGVISRLAPGAAISVVVKRGDGLHTFQVILGTRPLAVATPSAPPASGVTSVPNPSGGQPGFLGVGLLDSSAGIVVGQIAPGSAAERAGLKVDDVLVSVDNQPITSVGQVQALLSGRQAGQPLVIVVKRGPQTLTFTVTLDVSPPSMTVLPPPPVPATPINILIREAQPYAPVPSRVQLGVAYEVVTETLAAARNLPVKNGALILEVQPDSPADNAGLKAGDIVTEVDGDKVDAKHTLAVRMVAYGAGDTLMLTVVRGPDTLHLSVTLATRGVA